MISRYAPTGRRLTRRKRGANEPPPPLGNEVAVLSTNDNNNPTTKQQQHYFMIFVSGGAAVVKTTVVTSARLKRMNSKGSKEARYIYNAPRIPIVCSSLAAFIIIIVVCRNPLPFGTPGSGGGGSAELSTPKNSSLKPGLPEAVCVREPPEASQLGGGLREGRLQTSPLSWVTREGVLGEHRLT